MVKFKKGETVTVKPDWGEWCYGWSGTVDGVDRDGVDRDGVCVLFCADQEPSHGGKWPWNRNPPTQLWWLPHEAILDGGPW
jgi:hypothetical protein